MMLRFPFDTQTSVGYIVAVVIQCIMISMVFLFVANMAALAFGAIIFLIATVKDLRATLKLIKKMGKHRDKDAKMMVSIVHFIDLHADVRELSARFD